MAEKKEEKKPEEGKEGEGGHEAAGGKSKKKLIIIIAAVVVLLLGVGGALMFMGGKKEGDGKPVEKPRVFATAKLDPFVVNLQDSKVYLKLLMVIEYDVELLAKAGESGGSGGGEGHGGGGGGGEKKEGEMPEAIKAREAHIRDSVLRVLSGKKAEDMLSQSGKEQLKEELLEAINEAMGLEQPAIVAIYFLEFLLQ